MNKRGHTDPISPGAGPPSALDIRTMVWVVVDGPQKGQEFRTEDDPVRIGSGTDNSILVADSTVSRHHAEISTREDGYLLRDLNSTNGTFVDGRKVREVFLTPGTKLRLGGTTFLFRTENVHLVVPPTQTDRFGDLFGNSVAMRQLFGILQRISGTDVTVVILGETGTGKELAARAVHHSSRRSKGPFMVLDCSVVDRDLISSELFGHEAGAFTGAIKQRAGASEQAQRGTLFIDEVGELPLDLQAKLLRALEQREVRRLGGAKVIHLDCRVVAATHRDLPAMVKAGKFRQDLYYRLTQVVVRMPPLRERRDDIPQLAQRFLDQFPAADERSIQFSPAAIEMLKSASYGGNVRELRNVVERSCALSVNPILESADLVFTQEHAAVQQPEPSAPGTEAGAERPPDALAEAERATIVKALEANAYIRSRTAAALGISLPTLRDRIRRYRIAMPKAGG